MVLISVTEAINFLQSIRPLVLSLRYNELLVIVAKKSDINYIN